MLSLIYSIYWYLSTAAHLTILLGVLTVVVPLIFQYFVWKDQDLKEKYDAEWAVVTGGSSGIGRSISEKLASQGLNIVIVALENDLLTDVQESLTAKYPNQEFRAVGVDLTSTSFMEKIKEATHDIHVSLLFNNAGYLTICLFPDMSLDRQLANYNCNATSALHITHHFLGRMVESKRKGAICFTSSPAGLMPCPFSAMYGGTKAFLTNFATSLAAEVKADKIDVCVVHPSPVDTAFYNADTAHKSDGLAFFKKTVSPPTVVVSHIFSCIGRIQIIEQGYFSLVLKVLTKVIDATSLTFLITLFSPIAAERKKLAAERNAR